MKVFNDTTDIIPGYDLESIAPLEDILFFDIETTGLRKESTQVYLIGCAFYKNGRWNIRQYLTQSALDEQVVVEEFFSFAGGFTTLIHFNGDGFDIPYLRYKAEHYLIDSGLEKLKSFDIFKRAKQLRKLLGLQSMKQRAIEDFLKIDRLDELDGGLLIPYYFDYERSLDPNAERLMLLHNYEDITGMLQIIGVLNYSSITEGAFSFRSMKENGGSAILEYSLDRSVPMAIERHSADERVVMQADKDLLRLNVKVYEGCVLMPVKDVENYYYLPDEDMIVHKTVADFVDRKHRKKANKSNCFLKKEGRFLPQRHELFSPSYVLKEDKKNHFFELEDGMDLNEKLMVRYALDIMSF